MGGEAQIMQLAPHTFHPNYGSGSSSKDCAKWFSDPKPVFLDQMLLFHYKFLSIIFQSFLLFKNIIVTLSKKCFTFPIIFNSENHLVALHFCDN